MAMGLMLLSTSLLSLNIYGNDFYVYFNDGRLNGHLIFMLTSDMV